MRVSLDTNVLVSAFATRGLCADLLRHLLVEHELLIGELVLEELERVLAGRFGIPEETLELVLNLLREQTLVPTPKGPFAVTVRDPDDIQILASAQAANADVLVTGDRDLLEARDSLGTDSTLRILDPRGVWELLRSPVRASTQPTET